MSDKKKSQQNRFIIAVKDYNETIHKLREGSIFSLVGSDVYLKLMESQSLKVDNLNELKKFVRSNKKAVKEVIHYWEGLIVEGYTLLNVEYSELKPSIGQLCNNEIVKYICTV